jgi:hypothetical protein
VLRVGDLGAEQVRPGALKLIQQPLLRGAEQFQRMVEPARPDLGLCRGERAPRPPGRAGPGVSASAACAWYLSAALPDQETADLTSG